MPSMQFLDFLIEQSSDLIWVINADFKLVYTNKKYSNLIEKITGKRHTLNDSAFLDYFGIEYIEKWTTYYNRALQGESFEVEDHHFNPQSNEVEYRLTSLKPLRDDDNKIFAVACQSKDISHIVKQRSEANQMMDASLDVFCTINEQGNFLYVSAAAETHWGYSPNELIGKAYTDLVVNEDLPKTNEAAIEIINGTNTSSFVNRYNKKNGGVAYNLWSVRWDSSAKLLYCVAKDGKEIVEQKEKIQQSEERFKALVQDRSDLISITDMQGNYIYISPNSTVITGFTPEEFIGKNVLEFIHPDDAERIMADVAKLETQNKLVLEPFRTRNKNNEWRWAETVLTNMFDNPWINGIVGNTRDITNQKKEEQYLKLLNSVVTNTTDAVLITEAEPFDEPGPRILYVNEAFTKMTGYTAEEVIGKTPRILQGPNSNKEALTALGRKMRNWEPCELTTINYKKNGEEFWINFSLTPVADEKGWFTHWISIERDVTEQKIKEKGNELLAQIGVNFNATNNYLLAIEEVCKTIGQFGGFDWVELSAINLQQTKMHVLSHYMASADDEKFYKDRQEFEAFDISESLAGKVWSEQAIILWDINEKKDKFRRIEAANEIGLQTVLGLPLLHNNQVIGVLKIGVKSNTKLLEKYAQLFQQLGEVIGSELNRKKLEYDLNQLFKAMPDIIGIADFEGRILKMNEAGCELLGYTEEEIKSIGFHEFTQNEDIDQANNNLDNIVSGQIFQEYEIGCKTKKGTIIWLSWHCKPNLEEGIIYFTGKNITAEKKLRELNRQTRQLAKIGSWEVDVLNQTLYWSEEVHHLHETDPTTFVPDFATAFNFYRNDFQKLVNESFEKSLRTGAPFDFEAVLVTTTKKELWVRVIGNAEFIDGTCVRTFGSFQDINERKQAELRLQSLANNLPGVVFQYQINTDGTDSLRYVTEGSIQIWGFKPNEVAENNQLVWDRILAGGEIEKVKKSISTSIETKEKWTARWKYLMPNGEVKTHLGYGSPNFLADGSIIFNSVILDVTQETKNEELLIQASKMARIGSWELDLINQEGDNMYWSPIVKEILEAGDDYNPTLTGGMEFYIGESNERITKSVDNLIKSGIAFDDEFLILTGKGNERWIRCIGRSEIVNNKVVKIFGSFQDIDYRKKGEEMLVESEQKYRVLSQDLDLQNNRLVIAQKVSKIGNWETNLETFEVSWSKETFNIFGLNPDKFHPNHQAFLNFVHPDDKEIVNAAFNASIGSKLTHIVEHKIITNAGEEKSIEERWYLEYDQEEKPVKAIGTCQDITDRKKAEKEINFKANLLSIIGQAAIATDLNGIVNYWNKAAENIYGWLNEEALGKNIVDLTTPEPSKEQAMQIMESLKNGQTWSGNFKVRKKDGTEFIALISNSPVYDEKNNLSGILGVSTDVTQQIRNEELLKEYTKQLESSNERFEKVTEATNDMIWDWDVINNTFYRSDAISDFFGDNSNKLLTKENFWQDHFHPEDLPQVQESLNKAIANPTCTRWEFEYRVFNEKNEILYVADRGLIIRDENGSTVRMIGAMTNITEQKEYETQLEILNQDLKKQALELQRSNLELEQFAFVTSHDLQEPLRMVSSFMDQLKRKYENQLDEKALQYIYFATDGAKRMKQIILDLLEYSRAGKETEVLQYVDLNEIIHDYKQLRRKIISEKLVTISTSNLPIINAHKSPLVQIFHALLDNAIKYAKKEVVPMIGIEAVENNSEWVFSISDNGIGIDSKYFDKIFIVFQRLHNRNEYDGNGIGLAIVKKQVEFFGGRIWVESLRNQGSTFYFTLPKFI
jgi:PAS domain S-box-containing protein